MILRCTRRLLVEAGVRDDLAAPVRSGDDWYANLIAVDGHHCLLTTHAATLFSIFVPGVTSTQLRALGDTVIAAVRTELLRERLPSDTFGVLDPRAVRIARTVDRGVLGSMHDLAFLCRWALRDRHVFTELDLADLHHQMQRNRSPARGRIDAIDLVRAIACE
jgi:hypothetical protein